MIGPTQDFRAHVAERADAVLTEEELLVLLGEIEEQAHADGEEVIAVPDDSREAAVVANALLACVEAWTSVVSYALWAYYSHASRRHDHAGWSKDAVERSRELGQWLIQLCGSALSKVGVSSLSVGAAFPFGITVSVGWHI